MAPTLFTLSLAVNATTAWHVQPHSGSGCAPGSGGGRHAGGAGHRCASGRPPCAAPPHALPLAQCAPPISRVLGTGMATSLNLWSICGVTGGACGGASRCVAFEASITHAGIGPRVQGGLQAVESIRIARISTTIAPDTDHETLSACRWASCTLPQCPLIGSLNLTRPCYRPPHSVPHPPGPTPSPLSFHLADCADAEVGPGKVYRMLHANPAAGKAFCQFMVGRYTPLHSKETSAVRGALQSPSPIHLLCQSA